MTGSVDPRIKAALDALPPGLAVGLRQALRLQVPTQRGILDERDDQLRALAAYATGSNWEKAKVISGWLTRRAGGDPLSDLPVAAAQLASELEPVSARHLVRILNGKRS